jgi:hypothetical protein
MTIVYSRSDIIGLGLIVAAWLGAFILAAILLYARREYGARKGRTIGAILIDTSLAFATLVVVLGLVPFVRIINPDWPPPLVLRFVNILAFTGIIWFAVARLLVWLLRGDAGQSRRGGIPD